MPALRLVLFGLPNAGKTSLLGALAQAAQAQEAVLNGRLTDPGEKLAAVRQRLYEGQAQATAEEVQPFPVAFDSQVAGQGHIDALLVDSNGQAAQDLVQRRRELGAGSQGALGQAVLGADTLVLAVD